MRKQSATKPRAIPGKRPAPKNHGKTAAKTGLPSLLLFTFYLFLSTALPANAIARTAKIFGQVVDDRGEPLVGANVYLEGTILGSSTDQDGLFVIRAVPPGDFQLVVNLIGYKEKKISVRIDPQSPGEYHLGPIQLAPTVIANEPVVVTAGKYEQKIQDVPASLSTVNSEELKYRNIVSLNDALAYVSGVNLNGSQVSIRGSSGYTQGVGSRVLMLIDGIPLLTADTRDIVYSVIPTYLVERVEVLKGAGSALYGSSALGGVINVLTKDVESDPKFYLHSYGGIYSEPSYEQWKYTDQKRLFNGVDATYSRKMGNVGILLGGSRIETDGYRQNDWSRRWNGSAKIQWDISPFRRLTLSGNYLRQKRGNFLYWKGLDHPLEPFPGQEDDVVLSHRYYLTTNYRHVFNKTRFLTFRGIWFWNRFRDTVSSGGGNRAGSKNLNTELQFNTTAGRLFLTSGIEGTFNWVNSNIFGNRSGVGTAAYLQSELPVGQRWKTTLGIRFDYFNMDSIRSEMRTNPKLGLVFQPRPGTAVRGGVGLGFRAPSMAEAFTSTSASGLPVIPNLDLQPEKSIYLEGGINQFVGEWLIADVAFYYNRFSDLIEPQFVTHPILAIQFRNITDARILGGEINLNGQFWRRKLLCGIGYTYTDARDSDTDRFLKFRSRHLLYTKALLNLAVFRFGVDYRYIHPFDEGDRLLEQIVPDGDVRVAVHALDFRISKKFWLNHIPLEISVQINNALNHNYLERIGATDKPRNTVITLETTL